MYLYYELFDMIYESAMANHRTYLLDIKEGIDNDEAVLYSKVNRINCNLSRKLKQWWKRLNHSGQKHWVHRQLHTWDRVGEEHLERLRQSVWPSETLSGRGGAENHTEESEKDNGDAEADTWPTTNLGKVRHCLWEKLGITLEDSVQSFWTAVQSTLNVHSKYFERTFRVLWTENF